MQKKKDSKAGENLISSNRNSPSNYTNDSCFNIFVYYSIRNIHLMLQRIEERIHILRKEIEDIKKDLKWISKD